MSFEEEKALDEEFIMHTFARKPLMLVSGKGMEVKDDKGKTYLDFLAGIGVVSLGHCHPAVVDAITRQAQKLIHISNYYYIEHRGEVAKQVSDMLNACVADDSRESWQLFFGNSGAEANECAIKLARRYSKRFGNGGQDILTFDGSFHGRTLATLAATNQSAKQELFAPLPAGFIHVPMNDVKAVEDALDTAGDSVCAIMFEPIEGESGVHPWSPDALQAVEAIARQRGILLIADEVQSGIYRCGTYPFAFQNLGITPDIVAMAKGIASGFPMGACAARHDIARAFEPGDHGSTFGGSNLAVAAADATLQTLTSCGFAGHVAEVGKYFADGLEKLDHVIEVRGAGLMLGAELKAGFNANKVVAGALEAGFLLNATGPSTLRFLPPLICTEKEVDALLSALPGLIADAME